MIHFTCDRCKKDLSGPKAQRFVVKIAAYAGFDPDLVCDEELDDHDHMEAISELLERIESGSASEFDGAAYKGFRYDLCAECHKEYVTNPLGIESGRTLNFSKN